MEIVCLDLEGVLVPEIWISVAETTGIDALRATTRDNPNYDDLMQQRLSIMDEHGLGLSTIQNAIGRMSPLNGATEFLAWLNTEFQVVILSDTFYEFARPLMSKLNWPTLFCNRLEINEHGRIINYYLRMKDHKRQAVRAFKSLNFNVFAVGDSYNDTAMLSAADTGYLFRAPRNVTKEFSQFPNVQEFDELKQSLTDGSPRLQKMSNG